MEKESSNMFNDLNCNLLRPNWETSVSMDQNDPFESALSSMVSSPTASNTNNNGENIVLRELIGRLGTICNSTTSPFNSTNNSCYSTPLNSPPKLNLSSSFNHFLSLPTLAPFSSDPGFAERAARFSSFAAATATATNNNHEIPPKQNNPIPESLPSTNNTVQENWGSAALQDSRENSTVSDQIFPLPNSRKRKSAPKGKSKETPPSKDAINAVSENSESSGKKSKSENEPPKDYIHVRARRGQATDAHSLAERVRREKISERMKVLQDLVPGCNKVTGKAVMLDEIINYVQSLQRQVEFLSMKLATVNPRMEYNMEAGLMSKDMMFPSRDSLPHYINPPDGYPVPTEAPNNPNITGSGRHQSIQVDSFVDGSSQVSSFWEDDLHSIVQMGIGQQNFQGILPANQMKVEL